MADPQPGVSVLRLESSSSFCVASRMATAASLAFFEALMMDC